MAAPKLSQVYEPPASRVRQAHPAQVAEESIDVDSTQRILEAFNQFGTEIRGDIAALSAKVDVAAAREVAAKDRADRHEKEIEELKRTSVDHRVSIVKITAWAAGAGFSVSLLVSLGIAIIARLGGH